MRFSGRIEATVLCLLLSCSLLSCSDEITGDRPGPFLPQGSYAVLAWNDLGMHCLNPTYDTAVILPPYNTLYAQVVLRGDPPEIITAGIKVEYEIENNTYSYGKRDYGQFWDNAEALFGTTSLPHDEGLTGSNLSGEMDLSGTHFKIEGVPVTPVDDQGQWSPYQVAVITVKDLDGNVLAATRAAVPVSDEINCSDCHGTDAWTDILSDHDSAHMTDHVNSKPVLCASCHGSPALGTTGPGSSGKYLSAAIHGAHSTRGAACYQCHPGPVTKCMRSLAHTAPDGNCEACHGTLAQVASSIPSERIPWLDEPSCAAAGCHDAVTGVATGDILYRNAAGHGGLFCTACHGSPHAMIPTSQPIDNYQSAQYQGYTAVIKTLGSCGVCHQSSRGEDDEVDDFLEKHGGVSPEQPISCSMCHTNVKGTYANWPHAYTWTDSRD